MTGVYTHTTPQFQQLEILRALALRPASLVMAKQLAERIARNREVTSVEPRR